ncbi:AraC family transcriptional regulator [Pedobacter sp.]|uniref:helix-turn-helix transcriptional regulator n=1 Tax=Pedobacter sp. TaxID=1411316 RepID=UPI003D7FC981
MHKIKDYYLNEVDAFNDTIYCMHDLLGESDIPFHQHQKGQFLYTEGGVIHVTTTDKTFFLPARHYMWIPPNQLHSIHPCSEHVTMRNLYFPVEENDVEFYAEIAIYPINDLLLQLILFTNRFQGHLYPDQVSAYRASLALKAILPEISLFQLPLALPYAKDKRLDTVINYINEHLQEILIFPDIAAQFGLSERSLSRLFQSDVGMSFIQYLTIQRMIRAIQYLLVDKLSVKEVATMVGYNSIPTFSNTFYKTLGTRPSAYIKIKGVFGSARVLAEKDILLSETDNYNKNNDNRFVL